MAATAAAGTSMSKTSALTSITSCSSSNFPSSSSTRGNRAQAGRNHFFHPLASGYRLYSAQISTDFYSDRISRGFGLRRRISESTGLGSGSFGAGGAGIVPRRRLLSSVVTNAGKGSSVPAAERILASLGYVLPFFDGIQYGRYFFMQFPIAENLLRPLFPLLSAYKGFPYSNFIAFFSLYLLVVRNSSFSRYVRFNAMQAVVLDVLLILPTLVERTFGPTGGIGLQLLIIFYNTVFLFLVSCFLFGTISCLLGKTPRLPIVADAADAQVEG
ncbi:hypothetical protein R1flu_002930 [Riccia fluitans]|uniref:Protein TIC 20 n=1 Tax=Riccia fluitans TaxID=41844 RepID=A0ABD1Y7J9_9MARC